MKEALEAKLNELNKIETRSPFQEVARGSLIGAINQVRTAEDNLKWHEEAQAKQKAESGKQKTDALTPNPKP